MLHAVKAVLKFRPRPLIAVAEQSLVTAWSCPELRMNKVVSGADKKAKFLSSTS
jgi:hypothetical protein